MGQRSFWYWRRKCAESSLSIPKNNIIYVCVFNNSPFFPKKKRE